METIYLYFIKCFGLIALFFLAYYFLLRKETFFTGNRWFLLAGLFTSVLLPLVFFTKIVWIDPTPNQSFQIPMGTLLEKESFEINWFLIVGIAYAIGLLFFLIKFGIDFFSLTKVLKGKTIQQQADYKFIDVKQNVAPFSYFNYIVYNSDLYSASELENILEHEKIHSAQNHTIDVLIARLFCIVFWYNPFIWWYKKAILQNLEFIADSEATKNIADKKSYQITLLKITIHENCVAITNHFYQSLIKKRIIMLNKNQSKKRNSWKYCVVIPALVAFALLFQVEVIAKEKEVTNVGISKKEIKSVDVYKIKKTTTDQELKVIAEKLKQNHNVDIAVSDIKRNSKSELTSIKVDVKRGTEESQTIQIEGNKAIKDCGIVITTNDDGSKKINLVTGNEIDESKISDKESKVEVKKVKISKTTTNVSTDSNINTKTDNHTDTNTNVVVSTNANENANVVVNSTAQSNMKIGFNTLIIVDGVIAPPSVTTDDLESLNIKSMNIYKGIEAIARYGDDGKNGVIVVETRK